MLRFALSVARDVNLHAAHAGLQRLFAMTIPAVVRCLAPDIVRLIAELFIQLRFKAAFYEFGNRFLEQSLDSISSHTFFCKLHTFLLYHIVLIKSTTLYEQIRFTFAQTPCLWALSSTVVERYIIEIQFSSTRFSTKITLYFSFSRCPFFDILMFAIHLLRSVCRFSFYVRLTS